LRIAKISQERKNLATKVKALTKFDCDLREKQHAELLALVSDIESKSSESIQELIREGDRILGKDNNLLRDAWRQDVIERLQYEKDQSKAGDTFSLLAHACKVYNGYLFALSFWKDWKQVESNHN